jgi:hypothetical protein
LTKRPRTSRKTIDRSDVDRVPVLSLSIVASDEKCRLTRARAAIASARSIFTMASTDRETLVRDLMDGQYSHPVRIAAFNTIEGWSRDVTDEITEEPSLRQERRSAAVPPGATVPLTAQVFRCEVSTPGDRALKRNVDRWHS